MERLGPEAVGLALRSVGGSILLRSGLDATALGEAATQGLTLRLRWLSAGTRCLPLRAAGGRTRPLLGEHRHDELVGPLAFEEQVPHEVGLLAQAQAGRQPGGSVVSAVQPSRHPVQTQLLER